MGTLSIRGAWPLSGFTAALQRRPSVEAGGVALIGSCRPAEGAEECCRGVRARCQLQPAELLAKEAMDQSN